MSSLTWSKECEAARAPCRRLLLHPRHPLEAALRPQSRHLLLAAAHHLFLAAVVAVAVAVVAVAQKCLTMGQ
jgi:hypothetical protein